MSESLRRVVISFSWLVVVYFSYIKFKLEISSLPPSTSKNYTQNSHHNDDSCENINLNNNNHNHNQTLDRILPISFGLPQGRYDRARNISSIIKRRDFAQIIPGVKSTYAFQEEDAYYNSYSEAYYGITFKKQGWDCMRHYEIIASGAIPYFVDIRRLPPKTMFDFPTELVKLAMVIPGVPDRQTVKQAIAKGSTDDLHIDHSIFNITEYNRIQKEITAIALRHLTWPAKARYLLSVMQLHYPCLASSPPRVLVVAIPDCGYMSCAIWGGLYELLGSEHMSSLIGAKTALFSSIPNNGASSMWGKGFSYQNTYDNVWDEHEMDRITMNRLEQGYFNVIVFMNESGGFCDLSQYTKFKKNVPELLLTYQQLFNPFVIVIDGNDEGGK